jgi:hypothetical protein
LSGDATGGDPFRDTLSDKLWDQALGRGRRRLRFRTIPIE